MRESLRERERERERQRQLSESKVRDLVVRVFYGYIYI